MTPPAGPDLVDLMVDLYQDGLSPDRIANLVGYSPTTVRRHLRTRGVLLPRRYPRPEWRIRVFPPEVVERLVRDYTAGRIALRGAARRLGCCVPTARRILREAGVDTSPPVRKPIPEDLVAEILCLYAQGWGFIRIGCSLGIPARAVRKTIVDHGIPFHPGGPHPRHPANADVSIPPIKIK